MIEAAAVLEALGPYLARQRWYSGSETPGSLRVIDERVERHERPGLTRLLVDADGAIYQVLLGSRSPRDWDFLNTHGGQVLGEFDGPDGRLLVYDASLDAELGLALLEIVAGGEEQAEHVRPVGGEQSNSSLVFDNRLILKLFRRLHPGRNLDVEMTKALSDVGFDHVAEPMATWRTEGELDFDLAVLQPFLVGGVDGWALALTSLRDLFAVSDTQQVPIIVSFDDPPVGVDPAQAGGDFSAEARRLGTITADMHIALVAAFGEEPGDPRLWADQIADQVERVSHPDVDLRSARQVVDALRSVGDAGPSIRVHGDYHLGQVLRTDAGWYVLDFEGEPARPPEERRRRSSPLRDVAGMLRSFHYASAVSRHERHDDPADAASAWEVRNRKSFLEGYVRAAGSGGILPDPAATEVVLAAFELEKAVYELGYERAHRPEWEPIPLAALQRLGAG